MNVPRVDRFAEFLVEHRGWVFPPLAGDCDRCGSDPGYSVVLAEPFPVTLWLCAHCLQHVQTEAAKEYSGYLGLATVYALAYQHAESRRPVKGAARRAQRGHP